MVQADALYFFPNTGVFDGGMSSGNGFWAPTRWATGQGVGTTDQFLADVDGDKKADLVTFDRATGNWNVSKSDGAKFGGYTLWLMGMGKNS